MRLFTVQSKICIATLHQGYQPCRIHNLQFDKTHIFHHRSMARIRALPRNKLWVQVYTSTLRGIAARRNRYRRRLQAALEEALRDARLDADTILWAGKRLEKINRSTDITKHGLGGGMTSTLHVLGQKGMLEVPWEDVKKQMGSIVKKVKQNFHEGNLVPKRKVPFKTL